MTKPIVESFCGNNNMDALKIDQKGTALLSIEIQFVRLWFLAGI